jgi:hypothetical protein
MTFRLPVPLAVICAVPLVGLAQTQPQAHLDQAKQLLATIDVPPQTDAGRRIAALKEDFTDLAATYLLPSPALSATRGGQGERRVEGSRPVDAGGGVPAAAGTAGTNAVERDWRAKYRAVENDLAALIGPADARSKSAGIAQLDPAIRKQLEDVRTQLQLFYAGTMSDPDGNPVAHTGAPAGAAPQTPPSVTANPSVMQPPMTQSSTPVVDTDLGTALALLDRIQRILADATKDEMGKVSIDRGAIDEIRAEVTQIKTILDTRRR